MDNEQELTPERQQIWDTINGMMDVGYGCAEAFVYALGEHLWGEVDDSVRKISTGFSGGVGGSHEELCGGVSGAAIIVGLLYGRTTNDESKMVRCKRLIAEHRDRFVEKFGTTVCQELRDAQFGADERNPCSAMIAPAAFLLLDVLEEESRRESEEAERKEEIDEIEVLPLEEYQKEHMGDSADALLGELEREALPHEHRYWIGERLNQLGDPRQGVGLTEEGLPEFVWLPVGGGEVDVEREGVFEVAPFHLAKYPVTDQQFHSFLDDPEGFSSPTWWEGLAANQEHISSPGEQRFEGGNHPRENVSWYDAVAFCRWMTEKVLGNEDNVGVPEQIVNKIRDEGWEIRLPTEWEWQMAATGGQPDHKFPWGMDWDEGRANTKHNQLNKTTAVGMYPSGVSPVGAYDLSGNVWEWCLNAYSDPEDLDLSREDRRVLRGGSWYHWGSYATTEMRSRYYPDYRYNAGGFRVICGPPLD